ncbi:protein scylla-like isoform X2 [Neocloeon triangulifer]|uniref:protein scylla-like isoform X2 n=1 Tax=Neocloeon triangulifer TaxID=2078957 RepID=UPI00286F9E99|nr:protein scylla-like isoform X2 [Neocloeon triangulifer]
MAVVEDRFRPRHSNQSSNNDGLVQREELCPWDSDECLDGAAVLAGRLEEALRRAKSEHLSCGEVLLPATLLPRVARDVARLAEDEPCGLRGCRLVLQLDDAKRPLGCVPCEAVATFEVFVTLRQDLSPWQALLPQFLKRKAPPSTVVLSPSYEVRKRKLFR